MDDFLFLFPNSTAHIQFTPAVIFLRVLGAPLSWKKLEFDPTIEWNGWSIQPTLMTAQLPKFKFHKITTLIYTLLEHPWRKNLEKIIGIMLWATSMVHHTRFLLTSLYRDLYAIPVANYSIQPTQWEYFLTTLNDDAAISVQNTLHLPIGARVVLHWARTVGLCGLWCVGWVGGWDLRCFHLVGRDACVRTSELRF